MAASTEAVKLLNQATELVHPELHHIGLAGLEQLRKEPQTARLASEWPSAFTGCAVVVNRLTRPHRDSRAEPSWYDMLVSLGTFKSAKLDLPELGLELDYRPGTVVAFCGNIFLHRVDNWGEGDRLCYAFFMRRGVLSRLGQKGGDWVLDKLYEI
jgi:hypothetical protein